MLHCAPVPPHWSLQWKLTHRLRQQSPAVLHGSGSMPQPDVQRPLTHGKLEQQVFGAAVQGSPAPPQLDAQRPLTQILRQQWAAVLQGSVAPPQLERQRPLTQKPRQQSPSPPQGSPGWRQACATTRSPGTMPASKPLRRPRTTALRLLPAATKRAIRSTRCSSIDRSCPCRAMRFARVSRGANVRSAAASHLELTPYVMSSNRFRGRKETAAVNGTPLP
jgi:hypothetical protein